MNPIKNCIFNIFKERKIVFPDPITFLIFIEHSLCNHQLVSILIKRVHKDCKKSNQNWKKPPSIRKHLINFTNFTLHINISSIHVQINESIIIFIVFQLYRCLPKWMYKISLMSNFLLNWHKSHISFDFVWAKLYGCNYSSFCCKC